MEEITLKIRGEFFGVRKEVLSKHSDYFQAMFSGNYMEDQQKEVSIDILEPSTMSMILQYMNSGSVDLSKHCLSVICEIATAADFLQMTDFIKQIEKFLFLQLNDENWMETMAIAEKLSFLNLEQISAAFGVYCFKSMKSEYIPTINILAWYLSHPYLDTETEVDAFKFGLQWILNNESGADALLIVLACLDFKRLSHQEIQEIKNCMLQHKFENSLASKVVDCVSELLKNGLEMSDSVVNEQKSELCDKFGERVYTEAMDILQDSNSRLLNYSLVVATLDPDNTNIYGCRKYSRHKFQLHNYLSTLNLSTGYLEKWLPVVENTAQWKAISWGLTKLVIVYEENKNLVNETTIHIFKVKIYDTLRKEWTICNVDIPITSNHFELAVVNDFLYIVDSFNKNVGSIELAIYDLKHGAYKQIANLPKSHPPIVCSHKNKIYASLNKDIYCYEDSAPSGYWRAVPFRSSDYILSMTSYKQHIYYIHDFNNSVFRFIPDVDMDGVFVSKCSDFPMVLINPGNTLLCIIDDWALTFQSVVSVEEIQDENKKQIYKKTINNPQNIHESTAFCALGIELPPLWRQRSRYLNKYLKVY